jgi:flavin-dependent dehydrogenase
MDDSEFLAVGGGLAGAAFALELARSGRDVVILEGTRGPHHKVCGEFLSNEAQRILTYLTLDMEAMGASSISTLRLVSGEVEATVPLPFAAAGLSRYRLDAELLKAAAHFGATVEYGASVTRLDLSQDGKVCAVTADGKAYRARIAALATGKYAMKGISRPPRDNVAFKMQLAVTGDVQQRLNGLVQLMMFDDGYIGACLVEDGIMTLCWVMKNRLLKHIGSTWSAQAAFFSGLSTSLCSLLRDAVPLYEKPVAVASIPYGFLRTSLIAPNVLPIGDQMAVIPSYTGDGQAIALFSGVAAAQSVLAGRDAAEFQANMIRRLKPQFRWANTVNLLFERRFGQRVALATAARLPSVVTQIARSTRLKHFEDVIAAERLGRTYPT